MDLTTIHVYDINAATLSERYLSQSPRELYDRVIGFFHKGGRTADVGSGCGRDTAWLAMKGFDTTGYDASEEMVKVARHTFPDQTFVLESLPKLALIPSGRFDNILCSAVLMHLPRGDFITAVKSLARILKPAGRLVLTYRESSERSDHETDGRLYTSIPVGEFILLLESVGFQVVMTSHQADVSRADINWTVISAEKGILDVARGLDRVQSILVQDAKTATYKFALIRALCRISRVQFPVVSWGTNEVYIPLWPVAKEWLTYYWPLVNAPEFVAQIWKETSTCTKPLAFRKAIQALADKYGKGSLAAVLRDVDRSQPLVNSVLMKIAETVIRGPVTYAGTRQNHVFSYVRALPPRTFGSRMPDPMGWIVAPEAIWLDICRFTHWIEDSIIMRWSELTAQMNVGSSREMWIPYLLSFPDDVRDTQSIRRLLSEHHLKLECVWTGKLLAESKHIDHIIPFAVWGNNDLWNLVPAKPSVNLQKRDSLPAVGLIEDRAECLFQYWRMYREHFNHLFEIQINRSLGCAPETNGWEYRAISGLQEVVQRLATSHGLRMWSPSRAA